MKKKLFIGTVLPTVAALGVIGSGFSLWIFEGSNSVETTGSVGITVTNVAKIGTLAVTGENTYLNLDQKTTTLNSKAEGPLFKFKGADTALQTVTYTKDSSQTYYVDYENGVTNITFTTTITVPCALAKYVDLSSSLTYYGQTVSFTKTQADASKDDAVYVFTIDADAIYTNKSAFDSTNGVEVFNWNLVSASYTNEPKTLTDYETMLTAVKDLTISAKYEAVISITE